MGKERTESKGKMGAGWVRISPQVKIAGKKKKEDPIAQRTRGDSHTEALD